MPLNFAYLVMIIDCADVGAGSDGHNTGTAETDEEILGTPFSVTIILSVLHRILLPIQILRTLMLFGNTMTVMSLR